MIKPTKRILDLCSEMFDRKASCGKNYPWCWKVSTRGKLEDAGVVEFKGEDPVEGRQYYFTEDGLKWYLSVKS